MKHSNLVLSLAAAVALSACGGGGGSGGGTTPPSSVAPASSSAPAVSSSSLASVTASSEAASVAPSSVPAASSVASMEASSSAISSSSAANSSAANACTNVNTVQGFAALGNGTTGGADAGLGNNSVTVSNGVELNNVLSATNATYKDKPLMVYINGTITWENSNNAEIRVRRSNVSIIGLANAEFSGVGIRISHGASNIVIRNLLMHEVPQSRGAGDHIHLDGQDSAVSNIWIDHNEFYNDLSVDKDFYDELVSGRSRVHNVTISHNYFHDSQKTSLWGSSDDAAAEDVGRTISFHHNHWKNVVSRLPLFRFGEGHVWNNYYNGVTGSGINSRMGAKMRVDNNVFENVKNAIWSGDSSAIGFWHATGNNFTNVTWSGSFNESCATPPCYAGGNNSNIDYQPPYTYTALDVSEVKAYVLENAGRNKIEACLDLPEVSASSSSLASSSVSSSSSSVVNSALLTEDFAAADTATFFSNTYKSMPSDSAKSLYRALAGESRISFSNGELSLNNARFSIGDLSEGVATSGTTQPNGAFDLSQPYRVTFTITAAAGTGNFQLYVDNNTTSSGNSIHTTTSSTTVSRLLQMTPTEITTFPHEVVIESSVGTANSFFQIRADSSVSNLTIDNLTIEYQ